MESPHPFRLDLRRPVELGPRELSKKASTTSVARSVQSESVEQTHFLNDLRVDSSEVVDLNVERVVEARKDMDVDLVRQPTGEVLSKALILLRTGQVAKGLNNSRQVRVQVRKVLHEGREKKHQLRLVA